MIHNRYTIINKHLAILLVLCQFFSFPVFAGKKTFGDVVVAQVIDVHDGDTFKANLSNMPPIVGDSILIRINGIDAPEIDSDVEYEKQLAIKAQHYAEKRLRSAKIITLKNMRRDKYFRILADVYVDRWNLGKELIRVGLAVEYDGGKKHEW